MTEQEIKDYIKKFAEETGTNESDLEIIKKEELVDGKSYYGFSTVENNNEDSLYFETFIREGEYIKSKGIFRVWEDNSCTRVPYDEFLPVRNLEEEKGLEKLKNLWETGKIDDIYEEPRSGDSMTQRFSYYPKLDVTMKCDYFFEGYFNDSMIEASPELYKGRVDFDTICEELELNSNPILVKSIVSKYPDSIFEESKKSDKKFDVSRTVFGDRCSFSQNASIYVKDLVSECKTKEEVYEYISEILQDSEPVLDRYGSYWNEEILEENIPIDEILDEWEKERNNNKQ